MSDISKFKINDVEYDLKDTVARQAVKEIPNTVKNTVNQYMADNPVSGTSYYKPVVVATSAGKYWKKDGTLGDSTEETDTYIKKVSATNTDQYLPVTEGEVYRLTMGSVSAIPVSFNVSQCVFLNDDDEFVANAFSGDSWHDKEIITVPEGATKMHFTVWSGAGFRIEKQTNETYGVINREEHINYLNRLQKEQQTFGRKTFAPFDKAYITFVNDDCRGVVSEIVDVFVNKGVPICLASIYGAFNNLANSGVVLEAVQKAVENGGEVLAHHSTVIKEDNIDDFETMYNQFALNKQMLELYGFDVNGIILAGGTGQIVGSDKTDKWVRAYYQYSDLYGSESYGYPYYHYRSALSNFTLDKAKARIDEAIIKKEWVVFYLHEWSEFSQENMESLLDYAKGKDDRELEIVTYKQVYDKFCISYPKTLVSITATKKTTVMTTEDELSTDDIEVIAYFDDGSTETITSGLTVDISGVDMTNAGNYFISVTYMGKTVYVKIEVYSAGTRIPVTEGSIGTISYALYSDGVFELSSSATWNVNVPDYEEGAQPWYEYMEQIQSVVIIGNSRIGSLGARAFYGANNLKKFDATDSYSGTSTKGATFGGCTLDSICLKLKGATISMDTFKGSTISEITTDGTIIYGSVRNTTGLTTLKLLEGASVSADNALQPNNGTLTDIYVPWSEGSDEVANAPWGATGATIHYDTVE